MASKKATQCAGDTRKPAQDVGPASKLHLFFLLPLSSERPPLTQHATGRQRRIKCDEARPSCQRCIISRRECRGYEPTPVGSYSWQQLLQRQQPCLSADAAESRCLSYYHQVVGPSLDQLLNETFWKVHVPQILQQEPAARHAALAISTLHEHFVATLPNLASSHVDALTGLTANLGSDTHISTKTAYALDHYNSAIKLILDDRIANSDILLTISLLFTCIELLLGGVDAAAKHCRHGVRIHKKQPLHPELSAVFYQLGFFSNIFDTSSTLVLPDSSDLQESLRLAEVDGLLTIKQAFQRLDAVMARGGRLLRLASESKEKKNGAFSIQDLKAEQFHVHRALDLWWESFPAFKERSATTATSPAHDQDSAALRLLEARWLVSTILSRSCLADRETHFDASLCEFRRLVELAQQEKLARDAQGWSRPSFSFGMGYLPILHTVATKCRYLRTRVHALVLMKHLSCDREVVWDACFLYASAKFAIEFEHGLALDEEHITSGSAAIDSYPDDCLPGDVQRIVGFENSDNASYTVNAAGRGIVRRRICYYVSGPDGTVSALLDYTTIRL